MKNLRKILTCMLVITMILGLVGCAGGSRPWESTPSPGDSTNAGTSESLVIGAATAITTLDTNQEAGIMNYYITALVSEGLVGVDNSGAIIPGLATEWNTEDYATWTFTIRDNATFSDGTPVTVEDIIWSIQRAQDPVQSPGVVFYFPDDIESVTKIDDTTLQIVKTNPQPSFIWAVANIGGLFVTSQAWAESVNTIGSTTDLIVGSGPYKVTEFVAGSHVSLEARDDWWGGNVPVPNIRFEFIADDATRLLAFTQGDINFALNIPVELTDQWQAVEGANVLFYADKSYYGISLDETVEHFDNVHLRRAINLAIDRQGIIDSVLQGHGVPATTITPPEQFASIMSVEEARAKLASLTTYVFNMEEAKAEFEASGVGPFTTTLTYPDTFPTVGKASLVIADSLAQLGITVNVTEIPFDQWLNEIGNGANGMDWMIYFPTTGEPIEIASWLLAGGGPGTNPANFTNSDIADLITSAFVQSATDGLDELLLAHELAAQQAYYAPVWWGQSAIATSSNITMNNFNTYSMLSQNWPSILSFGN